MDINLELYKVFYVVAKNKSMSKAAKEMCVTQPAITKSIQSLETQLGATLFIRSTKGLSLSKEGETLYEKVGLMMKIISDAENCFNDFRDMKLGEVKIGVSSVLAKTLLIDKIKEYQHNYPGVKITIVNGLTSALIYELNQGNLDFVIYNESNVSESNVDTKFLTKLNYGFFYNKEKYELENITSIKDLANEVLVLQNQKSNTRKFLNTYLEKLDIELSSKIEVVSQDLVANIVNEGTGIGFLFEDLAFKYYPMLTKIDLPNDISTNVFIATNKSINPTFAAEKFLKLLEIKGE